MDIEYLKKLSYEDLRSLYLDFLKEQTISKLTINTAYSDTFYLWRNGSYEVFWDAVTAENFEEKSREKLLNILTKKSTGNVKILVNNYLSHLRRFRLFLKSDININEYSQGNEKIHKIKFTRKKRMDVNIPTPSMDEVKYYLKKWSHLENYRLQEDALNKLFLELCPNNNNLEDILIKAATLNDFYSTNIFSIYPVAKHIYKLEIDERLKCGDPTLVKDLQYVTISSKLKNFYSFTTKYCSHHNPVEYPIYDSYVDEVLRYFRKTDSFAIFKDSELKDYPKFKDILNNFRIFYGLDKYNLKQIDQYVWQVGKEYFPKHYGSKK